MNILLAGGAGFIGSHAAVEFLEAGHRVVVVDNLCNSHEKALERVEQITGKSVAFHRVDLLDEAGLDQVFAQEKIDAVVHFASLKAVGDSVKDPLRYFHNNVTGAVLLLQVMARRGVKKLLFSSSATVYGDPERLPITEDCSLRVANPYGRTKLMIEEMLGDLAVADPEWKITILRYFNPVGAHPSGLIGEDPTGVPANLLPFVAQVAAGVRPKVMVFGNDYPTPDGTGVRDYIHVVDLVKGHLAALDAMKTPGVAVYNLGTGRGHSVLEMIEAFSHAAKKTIPFEIAPRRPGDVAACYTDPQKATRELNWSCRLDLADMCRDAWNWQSKNPHGYKT